MTRRQVIQHNNTQHNDTQHNDTQHNDTQHKGLFATLSVNNTQHGRHSALQFLSVIMLNVVVLSVEFFIVMLSVIMLSVVMQRVVAPLTKQSFRKNPIMYNVFESMGKF